MSENSEKNTKITPVERTDGRKVTLSQNASKASADGAEHAPQGGFTVRKKFGGTETQIRSALTFYKWCAWISGTDVSFGVLNRETGNLTGGVNISTWVLIIHGWFYIIYLFSCIRIWLLMRWGIAQLIVMALGGVVPFLSFIVEKRIHAETLAQLDANPQATKRY